MALHARVRMAQTCGTPRGCSDRCRFRTGSSSRRPPQRRRLPARLRASTTGRRGEDCDRRDGQWRRCSPPCCFRRGRPGATSGAPAAGPAGCQARRRRRSPAARRLKYSRSRRSEEGGGTPLADCGARSRARVHPEGPLEATGRGPPWLQRCRRALLGEGGRCVVASRAFQVEPSISGAALAPLDHAYSASRYATMSSDSYTARSVFGSIR